MIFRFVRDRAAATVLALPLLVSACADADGFRTYECATPAVSAVRNDRSAATAYTISDAAWDETAVRQVLHVFALGGFPTDSQVLAWADMTPDDAIREMLTFDPVNTKLSPPSTDVALVSRENNSMRCLCRLFAVDSTDNPIPSNDRSSYRIDEYDSLARTWGLSARIRGLNPFRARIGFWETNYHLAISANSGVTNRQIAAFYDQILDDLARDLPYQQVLTHAALSPAVAQQYTHRRNVYVDGRFSGNEDFAREYHQLYFGILGHYDDAYTGTMAELHELETIPNTARALTDMQVPQDTRDSDRIAYGTEEHFQGTLRILETPVDGNTAQERFEALADTTIAVPESVQTLPLIIVGQLADSGLDPDSVDPAVMDRVATVRALWADLPEKNLLDFLRAYAISTAFHDPARVKYWNSIERNFLLHNLLSTSNAEAYRDVYSTGNWLSGEDVALFRPSHDVFGGQTGLEAANTADVFRAAYNRSVASYWSITRVEDGSWRKDWTRVVPVGDDGRYRVRATAEWLWERFVADGLVNFGPLERAHVYALLASGEDLARWLDPASPGTVYSTVQVSTPGTTATRIAESQEAFIRLESDDADERETANYRVSLAVNFIVATPWFMAQTGR